MDRVKQTTRLSTGGKASRAELTRKAARKPSWGGGGWRLGRESTATSCVNVAAFSQLRCLAIADDTDDDDESGDGASTEIMVLCSDLHPLVLIIHW
jgi:hypothetical protein